MDDRTWSSVVPDPRQSGPLDRGQADALLARAEQLLNAGELEAAAVYYQRVVGAPVLDQTAAALHGLATALYRLDHEDQALATFQQILSLPETPFTYLAWREIAGFRVRDGDLPGARKAYLEAERRAPPEDRAEIASRLGWLAKETGNQRQASRYFARSRGTVGQPLLTLGIIVVTTLVSIVAFGDPSGSLFNTLALNKQALADGEYWRLWTVTLLHGGYLHLFFNMYALYLAGALVEQLYGSALFLAIYLLSAAAGSVSSFVFGGDITSIGASGAIFGLFGVLLAVSRTHHPVLDRRGQWLLGQMGVLIVINLGLSFIIPNIDISAHIGGLVAGLWLGFLLVPGRVPTLGSLWRRPSGEQATVGLPLPLRTLGVVALVVVIAVGLAVGTQARNRSPRAGAGEQTHAAPAVVGWPAGDTPASADRGPADGA